MNGKFPSRYSRHYYDLYKLAHSDIKTRALNDASLLKSVVDFKMTFWRSNAARYDLCVLGTLKLMPPKGFHAPGRAGLRIHAKHDLR